MKLKPIERILIPRLYFNKTMVEFEDCLKRMIRTLVVSELIKPENILQIAIDGMAVDIARNTAVLEASTAKADAIVWLDTDMIYPDDAIVRLVLMANAGYPIAGGLYRRALGKREVLTFVKDWNTDATLEELDSMATKNGTPVPVLFTAGGFTIVRMEVYKAIAKQTGLPWYCNWDFRSEHGMCGEDRFFALRAVEIGIQTFVDPELCAVHWPPRTLPVPVRPDQPELKYTRYASGPNA